MKPSSATSESKSPFDGFQRSDSKDDDATRRAKRIHNHMMYCQHYDGMALMGDGVCKAGVRYDDVGGNATERPCLGGHNMPNALTLCPKWVRNTLEQGIARHEEIEGVLTRMRVVGPVVSKWRRRIDEAGCRSGNQARTLPAPSGSCVTATVYSYRANEERR